MWDLHIWSSDQVEWSQTRSCFLFRNCWTFQKREIIIIRRMIGNGLFKQLKKWMSWYCYYCEIMMFMTNGISFLGWCVWEDKSKVQKPYQIISQAKQKVLLLTVYRSDTTAPSMHQIPFLSNPLCHQLWKPNCKKRTPSPPC